DGSNWLRPPPPTHDDTDSFLIANDRAAVLFDFGGTLDADGLPWKERMGRLFRDEGAVVARDRFDPAYYAADDALVGALPATTSAPPRRRPPSPAIRCRGTWRARAASVCATSGSSEPSRRRRSRAAATIGRSARSASWRRFCCERVRGRHHRCG